MKEEKKALPAAVGVESKIQKKKEDIKYKLSKSEATFDNVTIGR